LSLVRLFIALDMPQGVASALREAKEFLASSGADVRWESAEKYHCTLLFLGDMDVDLLEPLGAAVTKAAAGLPPFQLSYAGIGFFPDRRRPRVVWGGIRESAELRELQFRVVAAIREVVPLLPAEEFRAHVTLGRVRGQRNILRLIQKSESCTFEHPPVTHREVYIVRSQLRPGGSVHTILRAMPLGG
jgi:2'-5' RNA ligase